MPAGKNRSALIDETDIRTKGRASMYPFWDAPEHSPVYPLRLLTHREFEILKEIATGDMNKDIAPRLHITVGSIKTHISNMLAKTGCNNRTQLAVLAAKARIL